MHIDFDKELRDPRGKPFHGPVTVQHVLDEINELARKEPGTTLEAAMLSLRRLVADLKGKPQTLADLCYDVLSGSKASREGKSDEKRARAKLAARVAQGGVVDLGEADLALLKKEIEEVCTGIAIIACEEALVEWKPAYELEEKAAE